MLSEMYNCVRSGDSHIQPNTMSYSLINSMQSIPLSVNIVINLESEVQRIAAHLAKEFSLVSRR